MLSILLRRPGTHTNAAVAGHPVPLTAGDLMLGSVFQVVTGHPHPLMPEPRDHVVTETEATRAELALANMNK